MNATTLMIIWMAAWSTVQDPPRCDDLRERVTFQTEDDQEIVADLYVVKKSAPTVICLHMAGSRRSSWRPVFNPLLARGLNVLTIDLRGHGESAKLLQVKARNRDPETFQGMYQDVAAAVKFLESRGLDSSRIGLLGASVGCSAAIDAITRDRGPFRCAVLMTPGPRFLGVDSIEDAKSWPGPPTLIFTGKDEETMVREVLRALKARAPKTTELVTFKQTRIHGTRMFRVVPEVKEQITNFFHEHLVSSPDLRVPHFKAKDTRVQTAGFVRDTMIVDRTVKDVRYSLMVFAVGDQLTLGAMVEGAFDGTARLRIDGATLAFPMDTENRTRDPIPVNVEGRPGVSLEGKMGHYRGITWVNLELGLESWIPESGAALSLEMEPTKGEQITIPADGRPFDAGLFPIAPERKG